MHLHVADGRERLFDRGAVCQVGTALEHMKELRPQLRPEILRQRHPMVQRRLGERGADRVW
ncbi:MAG: hypothetical protein WDN76_13305 [Alphaproteobacteria bacterium]